MLGSVGSQKQHMLNLKTKGVINLLLRLWAWFVGLFLTRQVCSHQGHSGDGATLISRSNNSRWENARNSRRGCRMHERGRLSLAVSMTSVRLLITKLGYEAMLYVSSSQSPWCRCVPSFRSKLRSRCYKLELLAVPIISLQK